LRQVTSKIQRTTPRDLVHVSILAGGNRGGASKASLNGGPKVAASDDGCMSITLSGAGKGGIDIHTTAAASDRRRVQATGERKRMGPNSLRCPDDTRYSNTPVRPSAAPPGRQTAPRLADGAYRGQNPKIGGRMPLLFTPGRPFHSSQRKICPNHPSHPSSPSSLQVVVNLELSVHLLRARMKNVSGLTLTLGLPGAVWISRKVSSLAPFGSFGALLLPRPQAGWPRRCADVRTPSRFTFCGLK